MWMPASTSKEWSSIERKSNREAGARNYFLSLASAVAARQSHTPIPSSGRLLKKSLAFPSDHFSVASTPIEAWASIKRFRAKRTDFDPNGDDGPGPYGERNAPAGLWGETLSNANRASPNAPDALLDHRGHGMEARLCCISHGLMENRSGLIVDLRQTRVSGRAERSAVLEMIEAHSDQPRAITLGADKGYDAVHFL